MCIVLIFYIYTKIRLKIRDGRKDIAYRGKHENNKNNRTLMIGWKSVTEVVGSNNI